MRLTLLGTGSADGWPNPFCGCSSCAAERHAGRSRRPSAALIDDVLLIDCGPTTPHLPTGIDLVELEHVLVTHGHPDHVHPAFLLTRSWAHASTPLHVWGPAEALALCRDWCGPDDPVTLHPLVPGDVVDLDTSRGRFIVRALAARHAHGDGDVLAREALIYCVTAPDASTLLYATDTGPFDPDEISLPTQALDVVLLDATFGDRHDHGTGHLDLRTLPAQVEALRTHGAVTTGTRVLATHMSHHNPPSVELRARLAPAGIEVPADFDVIDTSGIGHRTLVLGGARSGKSTYAEGLLRDRGTVTYVATGGSRDDDPEWQLRVQAHRDRRPSTWQTVESTDVASSLAAATGPVLVDCLALWLTAQLDELDAWARADRGEHAQVVEDAVARIEALAAALRTSRHDVVIVSNEVGMGVVPAHASGRLFRDLLGIANATVAAECEDVVLMVAGRPMSLEPQGVRT